MPSRPTKPGRSTAGWLFSALLGAWVASCSADVDGFHLAEALSGDDSGTGASAMTSAGGGAGHAGQSLLPAGGGAGRPSTGGSGGRDAGDDSSTDGAPPGNGGAAGGGGIGAGGDGAGGDGAGGDGAGGLGNGGRGSGGDPPITGGAPPGDGGRGNGGTPPGNGGTPPGNGGSGNGGSPPGNGGTPPGNGGSGNGGSGNGGSGNGGSGNGGSGNGGSGNGGSGNGGSGTGGTCSWPCDPGVVVQSPPNTLTGITAAAWGGNPKRFFLLKPSANAFYAVLTDGTVTGPFSTPAGALAPRAFGANDTHVFIATSSAIYRVPHAGSTSVAGISVTLGAVGNLSGAHAGSYFLLGNANNGAPARSLLDGASAVDTHSALQEVGNVATDGQRFAFRLPVAIHDVVAGNFSPNAGPCVGGVPTDNYSALSVRGATVAWVERSSGGPYRLYLGNPGATSCPTVGPVPLNTVGTKAVGLLDDRYALVVDGVSGTLAQVSIWDTVTAARRGAPLANVSIGVGSADSFVVSADLPPRHAVLVSGDRPSLIGF